MSLTELLHALLATLGGESGKKDNESKGEEEGEAGVAP